MADWVSIFDSQVDPDAPITSEIGYAFRDNPIAIAEGATGAPRITQTAIMNPTAGTFRTITDVSGNTAPADPSNTKSVILFSFSFITPGTARFRTVVSSIVGSSALTEIRVLRVRNGNSTVLVSYGTTGTRTDDFTFQIGDKAAIQLFAGSTTSIAGSGAILIGNDAISGVVL